jgi:hypothetical protein
MQHAKKCSFNIKLHAGYSRVETVLTKIAVDQSAIAPTQSEVHSIAQKVLRAAWMSIALGLFIEIALIIARRTVDADVPSVVADSAAKVSWSVFVCVGLAIGTTASKLRAPLMGLLGLISAPLGFAVARTTQKMAAQAMAVPPSAETVIPVLIVVLKGLEYAALGAAIGWVSRKAWGGLSAHLACGLAAALTFGAAIVLLPLRTINSPTAAQVVPQAVNELLFPLGCSLVLFLAGALGQRVGART